MAVALTLAAGVVGAIGNIQEGNAAYQAGMYNAARAEEDAILAQQSARVDQEAKRRETKRNVSYGIAAYGASGITLEGSPLDVLAEEAEFGELDALTIQYNGEMQARGYKNTAQLDRMGAKNARKQGYLNAAGTLLSAGSKAMSQAGQAMGVG